MTNQSSDEQAVGETAGREQDVLQHVLTKLDYLNSLAIEQTGVEAEGHRRAFGRINEGYAFILECQRSGEVLDAFVAEATRRQVPAPRRHDNPFLIFARASTGRFNHEYGRVDYRGLRNLPRWEPNRSFEKDANVYRWLSDNDVPADEVVLRIEQHPKQLDGIIKADRLRHGKKRRRKQPTFKDQTEAIAHLPRKARLSKPAGFSFTAREGIGILAVADEGELIGVLLDDVIDDQIERLIAKRIEQLLKTRAVVPAAGGPSGSGSFATSELIEGQARRGSIIGSNGERT